MTAAAEAGQELAAAPATRRLARLRHLDLIGLVITADHARLRGRLGVPALLGRW